MNYTMQLSTLEGFLMVFVRIASFVFVAPFFNTGSTPRRVKAGFSAMLALLVFSSGDYSYDYNGIYDYSLLIIKEVLVGLMIGFGANICMQTIHFAGRIIDMDIGLAMANVLDPTSREQVGLTGSLYYYCVMILLLTSDLHIFMIRALIETYDVIPLGSMTVNMRLYNTVIALVVNYFAIGFRIALPVFAAILMLNIILGIMARVAPQMNMFAVGMQLKILLGLGVIFLSMFLLPHIAVFVMEQIKLAMKNVIEGLRSYGLYSI
ncbi:MAG: flagellar biosynthetic protein FliR [Lachnospiraceae bacterium]|nr:flagellar biosynthetic protein FliR [Lachnospiraceae bacterium]